MAERNASRKKACFVLRQYRLNAPSLNDLFRVVKDLGYTIIDYSKVADESSAETLIRELGLESFARNGKSFVYKNNDIKLIFLCEAMSQSEKLYALAHELGHVYCGHLKNGLCNDADMAEEHEANEFAHYLLHPGWGEKIALFARKHKAISIIAIILIICGIISIPIIKHIQTVQSYYGEYYVTENGKKYHTRDCQVVREKTNIHRLTIEEYESGEYEPCQICLQGKTN